MDTGTGVQGGNLFRDCRAREWKCRGREGACKRIKCSAANHVTDENIDFQCSVVLLSKCKSEHLYL